MHQRSTAHMQKLRCKKRIKITSLEAAICNVALFKSMKDKEFRDTIFISYCEDGVILEAVSESEWKRANEYIMNFLNNKKIALLTFGYEKQEYEGLISKGLKQITRRIKQRDEECPYINIIHYQKIRKSCEYMDKQKYIEPLKDWETKSKRNPNFAFLIVEPAHKFDEVKKGLLQFLTGDAVPLEYIHIDPIYFIYLFFYSKIKEKIKQAYTKKLIEVSVVEPVTEKQLSSQIKITNFTNLDLKEYSYTIIPANKHIITKSGLEFISQQQIRGQCRNCRGYSKDNICQVIQNYIKEQQKIQKQGFVVIPYRKDEAQKYTALINKYLNSIMTKQEILRKLESNVVCTYENIEFIGAMVESLREEGLKGETHKDENVHCYKSMRICINQCPFLAIEYSAEQVDLEPFIVYLDQLRLYYCTYMVRFYGISLKYKLQVHQNGNAPKKTEKLLNISSKSTPLQLQKIILIFDYHPQTILEMHKNDLILDNMQIGNIILQLLYCIDFLHTHEQPRCLGSISLSEICWPMGIILPYLGSPLFINDRQKQGCSIENDIKEVGQIMKTLLYEGGYQDDQKEPDEDFGELIENMTKNIKQERWSLKKCITQLEQILCV